MTKKNPFTTLIEGEVEQQTPTKTKSKDLNKDLHKDTKKDVSKDLNQHTNQLPNTDKVEEMVFRMRKEPKVRVNGDLPVAWKVALDEYAHQAGVGRYHLVMYAVGKMLGKV